MKPPLQTCSMCGGHRLRVINGTLYRCLHCDRVDCKVGMACKQCRESNRAYNGVGPGSVGTQTEGGDNEAA